MKTTNDLDNAIDEILRRIRTESETNHIACCFILLVTFFFFILEYLRPKHSVIFLYLLFLLCFIVRLIISDEYILLFIHFLKICLKKYRKMQRLIESRGKNSYLILYYPF